MHTHIRKKGRNGYEVKVKWERGKNGAEYEDDELLKHNFSFFLTCTSYLIVIVIVISEFADSLVRRSRQSIAAACLDE